MRADKPNNGVGAKSPGTTSPKMIAKVTAKRSLFQRSGGFGSAFGSAFSGQRPSTTVNEDAEVAADGEKDTTTTVTKAQSFDGLTTTAGGNFKMSDDNFDVNEKKTSGRTHNDRNEDDVDDENNNNNVNKNVNNEWDENDSALTLSEKSRRKKEKREKKEKKKKKKKVEKPAHKENSNGGRYFSTERGENEREVAKAKDAKSKGNAKDKGQSKVDVNVDNDEDEDNSNISRVLTQLDASAARKHKTEALLKTYNHTNHARRMYDDDGNEMDDGDDEVLVPETQEEEDPKQPHTNVTQVSQSVAAKAREGEDIPVASSLSPVVKSQKKKKVSKSKSMDRMGAGDDPQRERTNKRKRRSSLNLSPVGEGGGENGEGGNDGMVGNFSHTTEQQRHKKKRKKQNSSTNSAVQLHRGR